MRTSTLDIVLRIVVTKMMTNSVCQSDIYSCRCSRKHPSSCKTTRIRRVQKRASIDIRPMKQIVANSLRSQSRLYHHLLYNIYETQLYEDRQGSARHLVLSDALLYVFLTEEVLNFLHHCSTSEIGQYSRMEGILRIFKEILDITNKI
jgi:hypothetical protein